MAAMKVQIFTDHRLLYYSTFIVVSQDFNIHSNILFYGVIMRASASSLWYTMCTWDFLTNMAAYTDE
jgi:hypothetical protein